MGAYAPATTSAGASEAPRVGSGLTMHSGRVRLTA